MCLAHDDAARASLQQTNGKGMAQGMRGNRLADPAPFPHLPAGEIDSEGRDRLARLATGEQPIPGMGAPPIFP